MSLAKPKAGNGDRVPHTPNITSETLSLYDEAQGWRKDIRVSMGGGAGSAGSVRVQVFHPVVIASEGHVTLRPEDRARVPEWVDAVPRSFAKSGAVRQR